MKRKRGENVSVNGVRGLETAAGLLFFIDLFSFLTNETHQKNY
jgi:hypothetical protein